MTHPAAIPAEQRARASFIPYCPLCSFPDVNVLFRPGIRTVRLGATRDYPEGRTVTKLDACCLFSTPNDNYFESAAEAAVWWRTSRLEPLEDPATDNRRVNYLRKLALAGLEPIE